MVSGSSIAANRPGHSPEAMAGVPVHAVRRRPSTSANALPASPDQSVTVGESFSAAATVASISASGVASLCIRATSAEVASSS